MKECECKCFAKTKREKKCSDFICVPRPVCGIGAKKKGWTILVAISFLWDSDVYFCSVWCALAKKCELRATIKMCICTLKIKIKFTAPRTSRSRKNNRSADTQRGIHSYIGKRMVEETNGRGGGHNWGVGIFDLCPLALLTFRYDPNLWASFYDTHFVVGAVRLFLFCIFFSVSLKIAVYIYVIHLCVCGVSACTTNFCFYFCVFFSVFFLFIKTCHFYGSQTERRDH